MVSAEPFSHGTGTLRCLQKEMATYRHWSVSLWRDPNDVPHFWILSPDKTEWRLISATLCGWRRPSSVVNRFWLWQIDNTYHCSWPIQPDILSPPLLRLTSRKRLWLDLQPVDIKSRWRHNWKSAQVVNSHLVCDPTIRQPGFDFHRQQLSLLNRFRTEQRHCGACRRKWQLLQTLIRVLVARPRRCLPLSNPVPWQNWMAAYLGYTADEDAVSWLTNYD